MNFRSVHFTFIMKQLKSKRAAALADYTRYIGIAQSLVKGADVQANDSQFFRLAVALNAAEIAARETLVDWRDSETRRSTAQATVPDPSTPAVPQGTASVSQAPPSPLTLSTAIEQYMTQARRERDWPKKTFSRKTAAMHEFMAIVGDSRWRGVQSRAAPDTRSPSETALQGVGPDRRRRDEQKDDVRGAQD